MPECYRLDPMLSRFTLQVFATGMLAFLGHSPTFAVAEYSGEVRLHDGRIGGLTLELIVKADAITLQDPVKPADRAEIMSRMRRDVLDTSRYPEITFRASDVPADSIADNRYRLHDGGVLSLRGVTHPQPFQAEIQVFHDGLRLRGSSMVRLSDYRIPPVTALGGTIRLKDEVAIAFDLAGLPEEP